MRRFAISDIHGCNKTFKETLHKIGLNKEDELYLLGDFIDRGHDSKGVIDTIFKLKEDGYHVVCLKGNHEEMLLDAWKSSDFNYTRRWMMHGGSQTIESFGGFGVDKILPVYREFLSTLKHFHETEKEFFVHAGLNFKEGDPLNDPYSMLWIRNWHARIDYKWLGSKTIIHGHTPMDKESIITMKEKAEFDKVIDIDAGCCYKDVQGLGHLCVLELEQMNMFFQKNIE